MDCPLLALEGAGLSWSHGQEVRQKMERTPRVLVWKQLQMSGRRMCMGSGRYGPGYLWVSVPLGVPPSPEGRRVLICKLLLFTLYLDFRVAFSVPFLHCAVFSLHYG